jgi:gas vesicle protein
MSTWKFWAAFGVGVATGAALALIYAPQSGARTRRQIRKGYEEASDYVRDAAENFGEQAGKYVKKGKEVVGEVVDSAQNLASSARRVASFGS